MIDQVAYWNGEAGDRWVKEQTWLDALLRPFGEATFEAAAVRPNESVLDVGCGCGDTSLELARLVGSGGRVVGLDVSARMLARAKERSVGQPHVSFIEGDASSAPLEPGAFDLLFSRFGVMFFADPRAAFAHLRGALRATGRLAFTCWRPLAENPWAAVPLAAAADVLGHPDPEPPDAPGPFSFADAARVQRILEGAGFRDVRVSSFETTTVYAAHGSIDDAVSEIARLGPVARLLVDRDQDSIARALGAIKRVARAYESPQGGVRFPAATWIVTARNAT
jgi:SAM-dependent methyltransferase